MYKLETANGNEYYSTKDELIRDIEHSQIDCSHEVSTTNELIDCVMYESVVELDYHGYVDSVIVDATELLADKEIDKAYELLENMEDIDGAYNCDLIDMLEDLKHVHEIIASVSWRMTSTMFEDALDFYYSNNGGLLITWYGKPNPAWQSSLIELIRTYVDDNMKICFIKKGV
jgi:hypothetical protein